jgi:hypothetical protein
LCPIESETPVPDIKRIPVPDPGVRALIVRPLEMVAPAADCSPDGFLNRR